MNKNPYLQYLVDESSGIDFTDIRYQVWSEGYKSGTKDGPAIKSVIRL